MKKVVVLLALAFGLVSASAQAATGSYTATVLAVYVPIGTTTPPQVTLNPGSGSWGTCRMPPAAPRIFKLPTTAQGEKMRLQLVEALVNERTVNLSWDDTQKDVDGYCIVQLAGIF